MSRKQTKSLTLLNVAAIACASLVALQFDHDFDYLPPLPEGRRAAQAPLQQRLSTTTTRPWDSKEIRKWGCDRTETPLIFVHIGKSGGGGIRTRLSAASLNYTKRKFSDVDRSYYPISNTTHNKAHFCNSCSTHRLPSTERSYEGVQVCHATTPIGIALACPNHIKDVDSLKNAKVHGECSVDSETCHVVYVGHNYVGAEMQWLPGPYLEKWWKKEWATEDDHISDQWKRLLPNQIWCDSLQKSRLDKNTMLSTPPSTSRCVCGTLCRQKATNRK